MGRPITANIEHKGFIGEKAMNPESRLVHLVRVVTYKTSFPIEMNYFEGSSIKSC